MDVRDLENRFRHHAPKDDVVAMNHGAVRAGCLSLALLLEEIVPDGREKSLAVTNLEQVIFWANAAIARRP